VTKISPSNNTVILNDGSSYTYDYLVVAPGLRTRFDKIEGATSALEDPDCPVGSIYDLEYAYKFSELRDQFQGGQAIFTLPVMPIKCGGAPQKIMYLSEETWR
jgi:sulfide:quinone oxidoreductase